MRAISGITTATRIPATTRTDTRVTLEDLSTGVEEGVAAGIGPGQVLGQAQQLHQRTGGDAGAEPGQRHQRPELRRKPGAARRRQNVGLRRDAGGHAWRTVTGTRCQAELRYPLTFQVSARVRRLGLPGLVEGPHRQFVAAGRQRQLGRPEGPRPQRGVALALRLHPGGAARRPETSTRAIPRPEAIAQPRTAVGPTSSTAPAAGSQIAEFTGISSMVVPRLQSIFSTLVMSEGSSL